MSIENTCPGPVAGIDEAGRGPLAGPVVAAAVILDGERCPGDLLSRITDSKALSAKQREEIFRDLHDLSVPGHVIFGVGQADVGEIDRLNILQATFLAMARAVAALPVAPAYALVDGNRLPVLPCAAQAIVKGDQRSTSIAAASIIAKVTRDRIMAGLAGEFPGYGWERNAGYGTPEHRAALARLGVTPHHRQSFAPVARLLEDATV